MRKLHNDLSKWIELFVCLLICSRFFSLPFIVCYFQLYIELWRSNVCGRFVNRRHTEREGEKETERYWKGRQHFNRINVFLPSFLSSFLPSFLHSFPPSFFPFFLSLFLPLTIWTGMNMTHLIDEIYWLLINVSLGFSKKIKLILWFGIVKWF